MPENNNRIIPVSESFFNEKFDSFEKLDSLEGKERERYADFLTSIGELAPTEDNVFTEAGQAFAQTFVGMGQGLGATLNEAGLGSGVQNYFQGILNQNQQWNAPEDMGAGTYIARAIGGGVGSTIGTLGAGVTATLATGNPVAGAAAAGVTAFAQTFGNNVQRNRKAGYSEDKAYGMAFLESAVDSAIESSLGVVGKGTKVALNLGRIRNISNAGKKELLNRIGRKMAAQVGKEEAQNLLLKWGKETAKDGLSEGFEEGLQYLNTYVNRSIGGDPDAKFSLEEFADNIAQGIIAGFAMGGVTNYAGVRRDAKMRIAPEDIENGAEMAPVAPDTQSIVDNEGGVTPASIPAEQALFDTLVTEVGNALGINIDFMDNREDFAGRQSDINGFYDKGNKTLYLNRNSYAVNPAETLGHELKHYIDDTDSELSKAFDALVEEGKNEAGDKEILELAKLYDNDIAQGKKEFSSDVFGKLFARPETWQKMAEKLDAKTPGMGEKFLQTLRDFYTLVKNTLFKMASPEAETFLNNVDELQNEAARMLAELRKKKASASASQGTAKTENAPSPLTETAQQHSVKYNERIGDIDDSVESIEKSVSEIQQNEVVSDIDSLAVGDYVDMGSTQGWVRSIDGNNITISPNSDLDKKITVSKENYQRHFTAETAGRINDLMGKLKSAKAAKVHEAEAVKEEKELDGRKAPALPAPEEKMVSAENAQTTKEDTKEEPVVTDKVATADKSSEVEPEKEGQTDIEFKDRSAELGVSFDEFYKKFKPSLNAILAKARMLFSETLGNDIEAEWESAADKALVNAYMKYPATGGKAELKTYASKAVANAINSVNREHKRNFKETGGNISLDQTNDQGEKLAEMVADENASATPKKENKDLIGSYNKWKETLNPRDRRILELSEDGLSPSEIGRAAKVGMTTEEVKARLKELAAAARTEGELEFSKKRGAEEKPIVNMMPDTPEGIELKSIPDVREYLRSIFEGKKFKIKSDGRPTAIDFAGIRSAVKKRGINRQALFDAQNIVINSYLVGYEYADLRHLNKHQNINGQFIYVSLIDINSKPFAAVIKLDDFANDQYAIFKDIAVKKITPAERGTTGNGTIANPPDQVSDVTIHQLVDFVKQHFKENKNFTENVADVFEKRLDNAYFAALEKGDIKRAELMVKNAAKRSVYHEDSDYQGSLAFNGSAPSKNEYYESKEDRAEAWNNGDYEGEFSLGDFADNGIDTHDLEWQLTNPTAYRIADKFGRESIRNLQSAVKNPRRVIKIYRAVDANIKENSIRNGDWITPSRSYAEQHIDLQDWESGRIIEQEVSIDDIWWNGDDINEWGYDDGKNYAYANTPNNRKLLDTVTYDKDGNIIPLSKRFNKKVDDVNYSKKRLHQQINPVVRDDVVRDEYADLLSVKEYTPETLEKWSKEAMEWILKQGGVKPAAEQFLKNHAPAEKHVATLARRMIINSDVYANAFTYEQRVELNEQEIDDRCSWGKQGRAMQLAALKLDDIAAVQALLNKLHEKMPPEELKGLRNKIMDKLGIDIYKLPDDIVNNKEKLDALLREELAHKGDFKDKLYEYWINAILSAPGTHVKNILGNTANAAYELGIKRFTEAMVNIIAGKKDGATFGEFKEMMKAFNWENARKAISQAYQLEVLDEEGKFNEKRNIAIGGGLGRFIRIPGRALKAADAFARAIIQPMETAAYAYRLGVSEGMTGERLQMFIQKQLTTPDSKAYQWGTKRSKELTFQEDSPQFINTLMALRESDGFLGHALKVFLPFIKTPYNILKQGVRKSPLGAVSLAIDTFQRLKNKKGFDGEYVSRMAEQLLAWGTVMAIAGLSDDDDLPLVTGASAKYGSAERGFKANKLPPFSIRIGGRWFSYAGIEPFATSLAAIVDSVKIYDKARNGKDGTLAMKEMLNSVGQIVVEKSYIDSVNEMIRMVQDPERELHRPITNTVASLVPNFYRQARQAFVDTVPDNKSRERGMEFLKDQFIIVTNKMGVTTPMPKIDFFGREVKKDSFGDTFLSPVGRLLAIKAFDADDNMDKAEKLIWDYNKKNPENPWYPDLPAAAFKLNGKKVYLAGEDYQNYAIDSGKLAHRQINNAIRAGRLKLRNPDEQDIELVKKIFSRARKETKQKYLRKVKEI